jgi:DNA gyrase/topoisomerase IV subunit A
MKLQLGYRVRDYLYYRRRCGNAATLLEFEEEDHVDAMIACNEVEKEVRLLLSKDQIIDENVSITPLKVPRRRPIREMNLDEDEEPIDAYKDWLANMHRQN